MLLAVLGAMTDRRSLSAGLECRIPHNLSGLGLEGSEVVRTGQDSTIQRVSTGTNPHPDDQIRGKSHRSVSSCVLPLVQHCLVQWRPRWLRELRPLS